MIHKPTARDDKAAPASAGSALPAQLEALIAAVWEAEENWRFDDRLDMALRLKRSR